MIKLLQKRQMGVTEGFGKELMVGALPTQKMQLKPRILRLQ
jgi:hypothetical protein